MANNTEVNNLVTKRDKMAEIASKINIRTFYIVFIISELGIILGQFIGIYYTWSILNIGGKIGTCFQLLFNFAFLGLFYWLYKNTPKPMKVVDEKRLDELLNEYSKNTAEQNKKRGEYIR